MKALKALPDSSLMPLVVAVGAPGLNPIAKAAPRFWSWFADAVAVETAHRHGMTEYVEPAFPMLGNDELEMAAVAMMGMAGATASAEFGPPDPAAAEALREIAQGLVLIRELQGDGETVH